MVMNMKNKKMVKKKMKKMENTNKMKLMRKTMISKQLKYQEKEEDQGALLPKEYRYKIQITLELKREDQEDLEKELYH